ncbi:hypothetical protein ACFTXJ_14990 [Streptomyces zhihengii]|uniref:hypothetical protein n=1 Tax=Streptomyces zhihengii TaxID=1818004 RepID=UPI003624F9CB
MVWTYLARIRRLEGRVHAVGVRRLVDVDGVEAVAVSGLPSLVADLLAAITDEDERGTHPGARGRGPTGVRPHRRQSLSHSVESWIHPMRGVLRRLSPRWVHDIKSKGSGMDATYDPTVYDEPDFAD